MQTKRWQIAPPITSQADLALADYPPILRQVLFNRGYTTNAEARNFLKAEIGHNDDPYQLTGMKTAISIPPYLEVLSIT